ncbi:replicative DNA helicase [Blattabacterium cuenoti]|uniref:replicative DNA helicase n=1 Tax=Blattabacterium cuenoti TaxID=1653831 RepID=UPI00163BAC36|nr:replicative DNA helicase [Blattabacterium cuenoti]
MKYKNNLFNEEKIIGKIPPQSIEIEEAIIGAILIDRKGLDEIVNLIFPDVFYKKEHKYIYIAIRKLYDNSKPVDLYTVLDELQKSDKLNFVGGELYLIELTQKVISSAHIKYHSKIILHKFILRELIKISSEIVSKCYDKNIDVFNLLDYAESKIFNINQKFLIKKEFESIQFLVDKAINKIKNTKKEGLSGISSGYHKLDYITSGWQNSDLIIIASRPGMGKTTFMLSMVRNIVIKQKIPAVIFSLEMSSIQLVTKLISSETEIPLDKIKRASLSDLEWNLLCNETKRLKKSPLFIDDTPSLSIFDLRAKCRYLISQYGIKLILVDYMQLMGITSHSYVTKSFHNREQEISVISRNLKSLAKELDIPIIALSQLSRAVETRGGSKRPLLSDLRESGAIEQDADIVLFIYRPEYYGFRIWDNDDKNDSCIGQAEIIISKHRNGGLDKFRLEFIGSKSKFKNIIYNKSTSLSWDEDYKKNVIENEKKNVIENEKNNIIYPPLSHKNEEKINKINYNDNLNLDEDNFDFN